MSTRADDLWLPQRRKQKGMRGQPLIYNETKKPRSLSLTDTAISVADQLNKEWGLASRSNTIEVLIRIGQTLDRAIIHQAARQVFGDQIAEDKDYQESQ